jgi:protoheme IX farnesyltransferase
MQAHKRTATIKNYYALTKPGVLYGNALSAAAGYLLGSQMYFDMWSLLVALLGISLVIGSACVINNYLDQDIDRVMQRTKNRPLVTGAVKGRDAVIFGIVIGLIGALCLWFYSNLLTLLIGLAGFVIYVWPYGAWSKRRSKHGTLIGAVSGAAPILGGYTAATGRIDIAAVLVFLIILFWQLPEFYSIAIYRRKEYKAAGVPVITVVSSVEHTKRLILAYTVLVVLLMLLMTLFDVTGWVYLGVITLLGAYWIWLGIRGQRAGNSDQWARQMFHWSLVVLLAFSALISVERFLP